MSKLRNALVFVIVLAALLGFIWLFGRAIYLTLTQAESPVFRDTYVYIANILAGLVGGVVAVGFGQSPPPPPSGDLKLLSRNAVGLGNFITSNAPQGGPPLQPSSTARQALGLLYAAVYVLMGLGAIVIWIANDHTPDLLKNLATISFGIFLPIVTAFFKESER
jgi:peptidoglycan/LPS O-acetylase OafA/YrhL